MINEEYIRLVIKQIQNGMNEDQALDIIKELVKNRGDKPKGIWELTEAPQWNWVTDNSNKCTVEYDTSITILDLEGFE